MKSVTYKIITQDDLKKYKLKIEIPFSSSNENKDFLISLTGLCNLFNNKHFNGTKFKNLIKHFEDEYK